MNKIVEICAGSLDDCIAAQKGGADRIELNCALFMGGLTPSFATFLLAKDRVDIPIVVMLRPRGGGFNYTKDEFNVLLNDAKLFCENGADGIAFGFLKENREIDKERTKAMIEAIGSATPVFHRAFDLVQNPYETIESLIDMGIKRVLTSGQMPKAEDGIDCLKNLQKNYGDKIEILAGSGVNEKNAIDIMKKTGVSQIHSSCKAWVEDLSNFGAKVSYGYVKSPLEHSFDIVEEQKVYNLCKLIHNCDKIL